MSTPQTTPPPAGGGGGYGVVADELDRVLPVFEQLNEDADGYERTVDEHTSISGDQTGPRVCPQAGDALRTGLQQIVGNLQAFATHALDIRGAVQATVANYRQTDSSGVDRMDNAGGGL
ncbi:hypothetical protein [Actinophytocola sp.]|uniref:hypothetical protein n=1 Tax=Actinophytocola sp. TaxID=1872138 RepID=UPI003D6C021F